MRSSTRIRLGLLAALALVGASTAWLALHQANSAPPATLLGLAAGAIDRIEVQHGAGPLRRFERRDGRWFMRAPRQGPAKAEHLEQLAALAEAKVLRWRPLADFEPARIGLEPPWATVRLNGQRVTLGSLAALAPQRYARVGDHVALIPARFGAAIAATPASELAQPAAAASRAH